jgi:hypothetical protein
MCAKECNQAHAGTCLESLLTWHKADRLVTGAMKLLLLALCVLESSVCVWIPQSVCEYHSLPVCTCLPQANQASTAAFRHIL